MTTLDETHDPRRTSWVDVPDGSDFPIQNLPFGVFARRDARRCVGVAIGEHIVDLAAVHSDGWFDAIGLPEGIFDKPVLNPVMALDPTTVRAVRTGLSQILSDAGHPVAQNPSRYLVQADTVSLCLPASVGDYVDFYSSIEHATNLGRMFRPDAEPLLPNWRHIPIGYHGRASTIVESGTPVVRPNGQRRSPDGPTFGPSERLDIELEVGFFTGTENEHGVPISIGDAEHHIFGLCLVNDWSARDIQAWEYVPLGPFLGKSFATSVSPWVVTLEALRPFRSPQPAQDPTPLPYLQIGGNTGVALDLLVELNGTNVSQVSFASMYWTMAQQLAHATANGTCVRPGDLYASGTISGATDDSLGSLIEMSWNGTRPISLDDGTTRTFLEDGDNVVLRGRCSAPGAVTIGFGECVGTILPAP